MLRIKSLVPDSLPEQAGVLVVVCCPEPQHTVAPMTYKYLLSLDTENIRQTVASSAVRWASHCEGYLGYFGYVSEDPADRARELKAVREHHKTGK